MEKESRKKSRTVTEQIEDLKKAGERAEAAKKNRRKKMRELNKRLAEEKMKALVKILEENGIKTENELKVVLEKAKKYEMEQKRYGINEYT